MISKRTHKKHTFKIKSKNAKRKKTKVLRLQKRWITGGDPTKLIKRQLLKNLILLCLIYNDTHDKGIQEIIFDEYSQYYTYCMKKKGNLLDKFGNSVSLPTVVHLQSQYNLYFGYIKDQQLKIKVTAYMNEIDGLITRYGEQANQELRQKLSELMEESRKPVGDTFNSEKLSMPRPLLTGTTNHQRGIRQSPEEINHIMLCKHIFEIGTTYIFILHETGVDNSILKEEFNKLIEWFFRINDTDGKLVDKRDLAKNQHGVMVDKELLIDKYEKRNGIIRSQKLMLDGFIYYSGFEPRLKPMFEDKKDDIMIDIQRLNQEINPHLPQP
jgi:hypothetical protein